MRTLVTVTCLAALLALAPSAHADEARPLADSLQGPAKEAYDAGKFLFAENPAGALTKFEHAYELSKDPRLLFNMAACAKSMRRYGRMRSLLARYLREGEAVLTPDGKKDVVEMIEAAKGFVTTLDVKVTEAGAEVLVDGEEAGRTPLAEPLALDVGSRKIEVKKPGFAAFTTTIVAKGGDAQALPLVTLARESARLVVNAAEGDAITVDNEVRGTGRWTGTLLPGVHDVKITSSGKKSFATQVDLAADGTRTIDVRLEKEGLPTWAWLAGGAVVVTGLAVGGYFVFKPKDEQQPQPLGTLGNVTLRSFR